ncbi:hypothetical protein ES703_52855 [subsurface metagenome]
MSKCDCKDWEENIEIVTAPGVLEAIRRNGPGYKGKQFVYCPWCGEKLSLELDKEETSISLEEALKRMNGAPLI